MSSSTGTYGQHDNSGGQTGSQVSETANQMKDTVKEQSTQRVTEQKDRAAKSLQSVASAIRQTGDQLRSQDQNMGIAGFATTAADKIEHYANRLQGEDLTDLMHDVERFARQRPAVFVGGAFAVGLLAARFLKSSSPSFSSPTYTPSRYRDTSQQFAANYRDGYGSTSGQYSGSTRGYGAESSADGRGQTGYRSGGRAVTGYGATGVPADYGTGAGPAMGTSTGAGYRSTRSASHDTGSGYDTPDLFDATDGSTLGDTGSSTSSSTGMRSEG